MKINDPFKKIMIVMMILIILMFGLYYIGFSDVKKRNLHVSELKNELSAEVKKQEYMSSVDQIVKNANGDITAINNSIIAKDGNVAFIESLETMAHADGLQATISSLSIEDDPTLNAQGITVLRVKLKTQGSWMGTYHFLSEMEALPFKIKIDSYDAVATPGDTPVVAGKKAVQASSDWQSMIQFRVLKYK